ncbi:MAG TPA: RDD family protein [Candidatus Eisenbacteria bacterium]|nr:RDD family protein [Candidatus Eisenbacteria bacterium]
MTAPPPPAAPPGYSTQAAAELAGFWRRFGAYLIDAVILAAASGIVEGIVGAIAGGLTDTTSTTVRSGLIGLVLELVYFGYLWSRYGQSIGYMALGIRLIRVDGAPISVGLAALRALLVYLSFAICLIPAVISAFMIGLGRHKQAIHDVMVGTLVARS